MVPKRGWWLLLAGVLMAAAADGPGSRKPAPYTVRVVSFEIEREPDGKRYPNQVRERFSLEKDGRLRYSAYFGGMPMEMNHNDSVDWPAAEAGRKVLETALRLANEGAPGLKDLPDDAPTPAVTASGLYTIGVTRAGGDSTKVIVDSKSKAWAELDAAFAAMVGRFEAATGRPKKPGDLPQRGRDE